MRNEYLLHLLAKRRLVGLGLEENEELKRQYYGNLGEELFQERVLSRTWTDCVILFDLTVGGHKATQIDALMLLADRLILVNVKYYRHENSGDFSDYYSYNVSGQLERSRHVLNYLLKREKFQLPIETAVVFVNPNLPAYHLDPREGLPDHVVQVSELDPWLEIVQNIAERSAERVRRRWPNFNFNRLLSIIDNYRIPKWYPDSYRPLERDWVLSKAQPQLRCMTAGCWLDLKRLNQQTFGCSNQHRQSQTALVLRVVRDFLTVTQSEYFTSREIRRLLPEIPPTTIRRILRKHFKGIGSNRGRYYKTSKVR